MERAGQLKSQRDGRLDLARCGDGAKFTRQPLRGLVQVTETATCPVIERTADQFRERVWRHAQQPCHSRGDLVAFRSAAARD